MEEALLFRCTPVQSPVCGGQNGAQLRELRERIAVDPKVEDVEQYLAMLVSVSPFVQFSGFVWDIAGLPTVCSLSPAFDALLMRHLLARVCIGGGGEHVDARDRIGRAHTALVPALKLCSTSVPPNEIAPFAALLSHTAVSARLSAMEMLVHVRYLMEEDVTEISANALSAGWRAASEGLAIASADLRAGDPASAHECAQASLFCGRRALSCAAEHRCRAGDYMEAWILSVAAADGGGDAEKMREEQLGTAARALANVAAPPPTPTAIDLLPPAARLPALL